MYIEEVKRIHKDKYDYSQTVFVKLEDNVTIICKVHGKFTQNAQQHLSGCGCRACGYVKNKRFKYDLDSFIEISTEKHNGKYDYSKSTYVCVDEKTIIICPIHGEFEQTVGSHMRGSECFKCGVRKRSDRASRLTGSKFLERARAQHGDLYDYSKSVYITGTVPLTIICKVHGEFQQAPASHITGNGCQLCTHKSEQVCRDIFEKYTKKKFEKVRLREMNFMELDGYCEELKLAFEYNGQQHYKFVKFFHRNGIKDFIKQVSKDKIRKLLCEQNGIKLITISHSVDKYIDEYIKNKLIECNIIH
jgi:hypothetical protein